MDVRFFPHNTHREDPKAFVKRDPHLRQLQNQPLVHRSYLLDELPREKPGIYTIGGGRQVSGGMCGNAISAIFSHILYQSKGRG
jgi:hypothetical protein